MECPSDELHIMKFQGAFFSHEGYYSLWVETNSDRVDEPERLQGMLLEVSPLGSPGLSDAVARLNHVSQLGRLP